MRPKRFGINFLIVCLLFFSLSMTGTSAIAQTEVRLVVHYVEAVPIDGKMSYTVTIYLSALGADGNAISGLTKDNFKVSEDGRQVEIDEIDRTSNMPIGILLLIDTSGSMQGRPVQQARRSAAYFVANLGENDQVALAAFDEDIIYHSEFTDDRTKVSNLLNIIEAKNMASTCLYDAAYSAVLKTATLESGRRALILLTDGRDYKAGTTCSIHTLDDVVNLASQGSTRVPIYTIGLGKEIDEKVLQRMSSMSGGIYLFAPDANQLTGIFDTLNSQLRSQYILTYTSTSAPGAHSVLVEMRHNGQTDQDSRNFILPSLPTTLSIISPIEGQEIRGSVKMAVSVGGAGEAVEKVVFYLGEEIIASDATIPYEVEYDFNEDQLGAHLLSAAVLNSQGEEIAATSVGIHVLEAKPSRAAITGAAFLENPLYIALGSGGLILIVTAVFLLVRTRKKPPVVFSDEFKLRVSPQESNDHTLDVSSLAGEKYTQSDGKAIASLTILNSDDAAMIGQQLSITKFPTTVGRSAKNDIVVSKKDQPVSRNHIIIDQRAGQAILMETVSIDQVGNPKRPSYGTFLNEKKVGDEYMHLQDGDEIRLGSRFRMRFNHLAPEGGEEDKTTDAINLTILAEKTRELNRGDGYNQEVLQ